MLQLQASINRRRRRNQVKMQNQPSDRQHLKEMMISRIRIRKIYNSLPEGQKPLIRGGEWRGSSDGRCRNPRFGKVKEEAARRWRGQHHPLRIWWLRGENKVEKGHAAAWSRGEGATGETMGPSPARSWDKPAEKYAQDGHIILYHVILY